MAEKFSFKKKELYDSGKVNTYSGKYLEEIAFPLGGIGTGSVSLSGKGELVDWEIFNRPNKGSIMPFSFFTIWAKEDGEKSITKVIQGKPTPPFTGSLSSAIHRGFGFGVTRFNGAGLPHLDSCKFKGEYPFAYIDFKDSKLPLRVSLEAYNPFIPLNDKDSGIPIAIFNFQIKNTSKKDVSLTVAANLFNAVGYPGTGPFIQGPSVHCEGFGKNKNQFVKEDGISAILMTSGKYKKDEVGYGSMALSTPWKRVTYQTYWFRGAWFDHLQYFWDEFSSKGTLKDRTYQPSEEGKSDIGTLGLRAKLKPGELVTLPIYISWYFPIFEKYWAPSRGYECSSGEEKPKWKNYYAKQFRDALDVARYTAKNSERLYQETKLFHKNLFSSTFPSYVLDAVSSQMSILKTQTCLRLEDGTFYGFEGCSPHEGSCEGSCTHVWNYAQSLAFLFPSLERSMRSADYTYNLGDDGRMGFRIQLPLGCGISSFHPAADGQMGGLMKLYRDWKLSGDDNWLKSLWPKAKKALEYAWKFWDADKDGVMEGLQHNTYDIEFYGPNTMMGSLYLGALRAAEEIANYLGETDKAVEYRNVFERGKKWMEKNLFNGEFFIQKINPDAYKLSPTSTEISIGGQEKGEPKYQYGKGCLSDQLIGQWFSHIVGLGYVLDEKQVKKAMRSIFKYNWKEDFSDHVNCERVYAINDDKGLLLCSWPNGGRPTLPFVYSDEVWCGIEYQVASHLIYEGLIDEGLAIVKGVRDRHDGYRRNPYNEFECGSHYARSMASWAVLTALSGFSFDGVEKAIGFDPRIKQKGFKSFWSMDSGWGLYEQERTNRGLSVSFSLAYGEMSLKTFEVHAKPKKDEVEVAVGRRKVKAVVDRKEDKIRLQFNKPVTLKAGEKIKFVC